MNFYEFKKENLAPNIRSTLIDSTVQILLTDDNYKPRHIEIPAKNTEFYLKRNSDTLLIVAGESWTYGEALPGIGSSIGMFDISSQIEHCLGPRMAEIIGSDLYQFSIPGNCNLFIQGELERILKYVDTLNYKKVYVALLMTENAREIPAVGGSSLPPFVHNHPIHDLLKLPLTTSISLQDWTKLYDELFFDCFQNMLNNFKSCPIEGIMFRNFTKISTNRRDYNFKIIEETWVEYTSKLLNIDFQAPYIVNAIEFQNVGERSKLIIDRDFMEEQISLINNLYDIIGPKIRNLYHNNHPTPYGHLVWALYLVRQAGWKNI